MAQAAQLAEHISNLASVIEDSCMQSSALSAEATSYAQHVEAMTKSNHNLEVELEQLRMALVRPWA